ncbi:MAG: tetratricopeptide repeat protein [Planctomycetota bacterium]
MTVNTSSKRLKRARLATALALSVAVGGLTGCSSGAARLASLNPFAKSTPGGESSGLVNGTKAATAKVAGWVSGEKKVAAGDSTDPTSLAHKAEVTPEIFVANGRLWETSGDFKKAMESYAKALEMSPSDPGALSNIARLHLRQGNHKQAAEYFGQAIKQSPEDAGLYNDLGLALSKLGNHSAAASTIEQALRLTPGSSRFTNNLACVRFEGGDAEGALNVLVENNKPAVAHFNMAYLHYKHGQKSEAARHLTQSISHEPAAQADPATKRAVARSKELLAQLGGSVPGSNAPGSTVPGGNAPAGGLPGNVLPGAEPNTAIATKSLAPRTSEIPTGTPSTTFTVSDKTPAGAPVGNASYKLPGTTPAEKTPAASTSPTPTPEASQTEPKATEGAKRPATTFELPPGFKLP